MSIITFSRINASWAVDDHIDIAVKRSPKQVVITIDHGIHHVLELKMSLDQADRLREALKGAE